MIASNTALVSLAGLENLSSIGGGLQVSGNATLSGILGLDNLTSIGGSLEIGHNYQMTSITGLENIDPGSIGGIMINNNIQLSECHIQSICEYLASPGGPVTIESNAPGCNSPEEVEEACLASIETKNMVSFSIRPNPSDIGAVTFTFEQSPGNLRLSCFDAVGQEVHRQLIKAIETTINVSSWQEGIYLAVVYEDGKTVGRATFVLQ